ncbi:hypothetical protein COBT_002128 [Conglomerata obtusa]
MFFMLFMINLAIRAQIIYLYTVPKRPYNVQNKFKSSPNKIILINGTKTFAFNDKNAIKITYPVLGNQQVYNANMHLYGKRNRDNNTKAYMNKNPYRSLVTQKNNLVDSEATSRILSVDKQTTGILNYKENHKDDFNDVNSKESEHTTDKSDFDSKILENAEESMFDHSKMYKNKSSLKSKLVKFYSKNKILIFIEIGLSTILFALLFMKFELYIYIIKVYRKCFKKRRDTRIRYETVDLEVEESPKVVNNSTNI